MNVVEQIQQFNAGRDGERLAMKYRRMRADPYAFLRASCHLFYARLPLESVIRKAPAVWACGDLHLENFGSYQGEQRSLAFDINDFDESLFAPATWDLVRCLASILVARKGLGLTSRRSEVAQALCQSLIDAYARALAGGKAGRIDSDAAPPPVRELLQAVATRGRPAFLDARTVQRGRQRQIRLDGVKALRASAVQREQVTACLAGFAAAQPAPRFFEVLDVARRIAGTGSLGVNRYVVLVRGQGSPDGNHLLDLKQALPASARGRVPLPQPAWPDEALRMVSVQRRMQAVPVALLQAVCMAGQPYVLRALQPSEDRVALAQPHDAVERLQSLVAVMGQLLAWAQLRSSGRGDSAAADELIDFAARTKWRRRIMELARHSAAQVEDDWRSYRSAYDGGAFGLPAEGPLPDEARAALPR